MPELPEVETIRSELSQVLIGKEIKDIVVARESVLRTKTAAFKKALKNKQFTQVSRRGKYLVFQLGPGCDILAHLGMSGKFIFTQQPAALAPHDRVIFTLNENQRLVFSEIRCFGFLELTQDASLHSRIRPLGCDGLDPKLSPTLLAQAWSTSKQAIKTLLLQQTVVAGIGNIYASEILFAAQIHPEIRGSELHQKQLRRLVTEIHRILQLALTHNGTSIADFRRVDDKTGDFQNFLQVYGKQGKPCPVCQNLILKIIQNQRSSFFCPQCQRK